MNVLLSTIISLDLVVNVDRTGAGCDLLCSTLNTNLFFFFFVCVIERDQFNVAALKQHCLKRQNHLFRSIQPGLLV